MLPVKEIRKDFPILGEKIGEYNLVYLDNAATTQMPLAVLNRLEEHYRHNNANVHRGFHALSERSTGAYEKARDTVAKYIGADKPSQIVFTSGTTSAINMVSQGLRNYINEGDRIIVTELEHHSNYLPWLELCKEKGADFIPIKCPNGDFSEEVLKEELAKGAKVVAFAQVSNVTGAVSPLRRMVKAAKGAGALTLIDGAQGARHIKINIAETGADFYCFSGHKALGPSGIGALYVSNEAAQALTPPLVGGGMVDTVNTYSFTKSPMPHMLEAGTPNYSGAVAMAAALDYISAIGVEEIENYESELTNYAYKLLSNIDGVRVLGAPKKRSGVISFTVDSFDSYDIVSVIDKYGIAVRGGTHCAQPALKSLGVKSCTRVSPAFYNTPEEIEFAAGSLKNTVAMLKKWAQQ